MDDVVNVAVTAIRQRDWAGLRPLLHPYLHWTDGHGVTMRGRENVLAMLEHVAPPGVPTDVQLRDGQIYRWHCQAASSSQV